MILLAQRMVVSRGTQTGWRIATSATGVELPMSLCIANSSVAYRVSGVHILGIASACIFHTLARALRILAVRTTGDMGISAHRIFKNYLHARLIQILHCDG